MGGLDASAWLLLFGSWLPWLLLTAWYVRKLKQHEGQKSEAPQE